MWSLVASYNLFKFLIKCLEEVKDTCDSLAVVAASFHIAEDKQCKSKTKYSVRTVQSK